MAYNKSQQKGYQQWLKLYYYRSAKIIAEQARRNKMVPNPNNHKLPKIEGDFDSSIFNSWLIYLSTTEEDQRKVWGNPTIMQQLKVMQPVDAIDEILTLGDKERLVDIVVELSGMDIADDEVISVEDYAKN